MTLLLLACSGPPVDLPAPTPSPTSRIDLCDALDVATLERPDLPEDPTLVLAGELGFGRARPHRPGGHAFAWSLVDPQHDGTRNWAFPDSAVRAVQGAGVDVVATLDNAVNPGSDAGVMELYVPEDQREGFARFVQDIVERYDADGIDDMPGLLAPVAAWEIGNEPSCPPDDLACEDAFVLHMDTAAAAARAADADVEIYPGAAAPPLLPGSASAENPRFVGLWTRWLERGDRTNIDGLVVHALVGVAVPSVTDILAWWHDRAPDLPLVLGEFGSRGVGGVPRVRDDPAEEAVWLADAVDAAFDAGADRVAWCHTRHVPEQIPAIVTVLGDAARRHEENGVGPRVPERPSR